MEEKILNDAEAEAFGLKRKILPEEESLTDKAAADEPETSTGNDDGEEVRLSASLDDGYTEDGYGEAVELPLEFEEATEDDESLVMLSPEEALEEMRKREEEAKKQREKFEKLLQKGEEALQQKNYEKARKYFTQANEIDDGDLSLNVGYMRAYSEDFTMTDDFDTICEVYEQCVESVGEPFVKRIKEMFGDRLQVLLASFQEEEAERSAAFSAEQSKRRESYGEQLQKYNGLLLKFALPLVLFAVTAGLCACFITAVKGNILLIFSIVFAALAAVLIVPTLFALKKTVKFSYLTKENERLSSTAEGRALRALRRKIEFLQECLQ